MNCRQGIEKTLQAQKQPITFHNLVGKMRQRGMKYEETSVGRRMRDLVRENQVAIVKDRDPKTKETVFLYMLINNKTAVKAAEESGKEILSKPSNSKRSTTKKSQSTKALASKKSAQPTKSKKSSSKKVVTSKPAHHVLLSDSSREIISIDEELTDILEKVSPLESRLESIKQRIGRLKFIDDLEDDNELARIVQRYFALDNQIRSLRKQLASLVDEKSESLESVVRNISQKLLSK